MIPAWKAVAGLGEKYEVICALLHPAGYRQGELHLHDEPALFRDCADYLLELEERSRELLDQQAALAQVVRARRAPSQRRSSFVARSTSSPAWRRSCGRSPRPRHRPAQRRSRPIRQFMSEGLAAGEVIDVLAVADRDRPEISVLSDEFLDSIAAKTEHQNVQVRLLEKLLKDEIRSRRTHQPGAGKAVLREGRRDPQALRATATD